MRITVRDLLRFASQISAIPVADIKGPKRQRMYIRTRMVVAHYARQQGYSYPHIGRAMSRDHSTIINLCQMADVWRGKDPLFDRQMDRMAEAIELGEVKVQTIPVPRRIVEPLVREIQAARLDSVELADWQQANAMRIGSERLLAAMRAAA